MLTQLFTRYDLDGSGTINSLHELSQLTTNLLFGIDFRAHPKAILARVNEEDPNLEWDIETFKEWCVHSSINLADSIAGSSPSGTSKGRRSLRLLLLRLTNLLKERVRCRML